MTLKPCPFCGGKAVQERRGTMRQSMVVACENCGCRMESGDVSGMTPSEHLAWNRRYDLRIRELEERLADTQHRNGANIARVEALLKESARLRRAIHSAPCPHGRTIIATIACKGCDCAKGEIVRLMEEYKALEGE